MQIWNKLLVKSRNSFSGCRFNICYCVTIFIRNSEVKKFKLGVNLYQTSEEKTPSSFQINIFIKMKLFASIKSSNFITSLSPFPYYDTSFVAILWHFIYSLYITLSYIKTREDRQSFDKWHKKFKVQCVFWGLF